MQEIAPFCFIFLKIFRGGNAPGSPLGTRATQSHASLPLFLQKRLAGMVHVSAAQLMILMQFPVTSAWIRDQQSNNVNHD